MTVRNRFSLRKTPLRRDMAQSMAQHMANDSAANGTGKGLFGWRGGSDSGH
jgi:hypothetical protein